MTESTALQAKLADMKAVKLESAQQVSDPVAKTDQDQIQKIPEPVPTEIIPERMYHVFYNTIGSVKMITETGRTIAFVGGKYVTDIQEEIDYLKKEISLGSMHLSTRPGEEVMTARDLDPMTAIRKQHMTEFKALQSEAARKIAAGEPLTQSESEVTPLTPGSTSDIANLAADSGI